MSLPTFPEVDPNLSREAALHMIFSSIASEEMALGSILEAESEKLQAILDACSPCENKSDFETVLAVNASVSKLLEQVKDIQMILKNKLSVAVDALPKPPKPPCPPPIPPCPPPIPPCPPKPPCPCPPLCAALYKHCGPSLWCEGHSLVWDTARYFGCCTGRCPGDKGTVELAPGGLYLVSFTVNLQRKRGQPESFALGLQVKSSGGQRELSPYYGFIPEADMIVTAAAGGFLVEAPKGCCPARLSLRLIGPASLTVGEGSLTVTELQR